MYDNKNQDKNIDHIYEENIEKIEKKKKLIIFNMFEKM